MYKVARETPARDCTRLTVYLDELTTQRLQAYANAQRLSMAAWIEQAVIDKLGGHDGNGNGPTVAAHNGAALAAQGNQAARLR